MADAATAHACSVGGVQVRTPEVEGDDETLLEPGRTKIANKLTAASKIRLQRHNSGVTLLGYQFKVIVPVNICRALG